MLDGKKSHYFSELCIRGNEQWRAFIYSEDCIEQLVNTRLGYERS